MYRFRTIECLLDKYNELENQEIYFASPEELNDPMEGLRDVFWKGDRIVWKNLIINYLKSLERVFVLTILLNDSESITDDDLVVSSGLLRYASPQRKFLVKEIIDLTFKTKFIRELPIRLSKRRTPIRRSELLSYLQTIHPFFLNSISEIYYKHKLTYKLQYHQDLGQFESVIEKSGFLHELFNKLEEENNKGQSDIFFNTIGLYIQSNKLHIEFKHWEGESKSNAFYLVSEFPNRFVTKLENDIYPDWYSASFLESNENSAVWGHYGDNHKGVCLKFKPILNEGKLALNLNTEYGYGSGPIIGMRPHTFRKIEYHNKHVEIDFFRSMGRLPKIELDKLWYEDPDGNKSVCASHFDSPEKEEEWQEEYWKNFNDSLKIKLREWSYENEYRLVVHGDFIDYSTKDSRKLRYDFKDLESITFGIKTPNSAKLQIMKIIDKKCKENSRKEFDFYQAYYSKDKGQIESFKMTF